MNLPFSPAIISDPPSYWVCGKGGRDGRGDSGNIDHCRKAVWCVSGRNGRMETGVSYQVISSLRSSEDKHGHAVWGVVQNPCGERTPLPDKICNQLRLSASAQDLLCSLQREPGLFWAIICHTLACMMELLHICVTRGKLCLNTTSRPSPLWLCRTKMQLRHREKACECITFKQLLSSTTRLAINCLSSPLLTAHHLQLQGHVRNQVISCSGQEPCLLFKVLWLLLGTIEKTNWARI